MKQKPLISVIVLSYRNYHYIYEALDSVLYQDYPNIELIITNDGSDDFDKKSIELYLERYKKQNIKNIVINNNKKNIGTVKNINKAIKLSKGIYIKLLAADDVLYDEKVITKCVNSFDSLPKKELIVMSQIGMYDIKLKKLIKLFISDKNKKIIKKLKPNELFAALATQQIFIIPSSCYKKEIFERYGYFDEKYLLVEDFSSALKLSRLGLRYNYFDFISSKHRSGGVSHGNINGENKTGKQYELDIINIMKNEILPFLNLLDKKQQNKFIKIYNSNKWKLEYKYNYNSSSKLQKRQFILENFNIIILSFLKDLKTEFLDQLTGKKAKLLLIGLILFIIFFYKQTILINIIKNIGLFLIIFSFLFIFLTIAKKIIPRIINFIRFVI